MNYLRHLATMLVFITIAMVPAWAQGNFPPTIDQQLQILTEKLDLTTAQQAKMRAVLQSLHDRTQKFVEDKNLTDEQRMAKIHPEHEKADREARKFLTDVQQKKLDQYEESFHGGMHHSASTSVRP